MVRPFITCFYTLSLLILLLSSQTASHSNLRHQNGLSTIDTTSRDQSMKEVESFYESSKSRLLNKVNTFRSVVKEQLGKLRCITITITEVVEPSGAPSEAPSGAPSHSPNPSMSPSKSPTPSIEPSSMPSLTPSKSPHPTSSPSIMPSLTPSKSPHPTSSPSSRPSDDPPSGGIEIIITFP